MQWLHFKIHLNYEYYSCSKMQMVYELHEVKFWNVINYIFSFNNLDRELALAIGIFGFDFEWVFWKVR